MLYRSLFSCLDSLCVFVKNSDIAYLSGLCLDYLSILGKLADRISAGLFCRSSSYYLLTLLVGGYGVLKLGSTLDLLSLSEVYGECIFALLDLFLRLSLESLRRVGLLGNNVRAGSSFFLYRLVVYYGYGFFALVERFFLSLSYGSLCYGSLCYRSRLNFLGSIATDSKRGILMFNNKVITLASDLLSFLGNFGQNVTFSYGFDGFCSLFSRFISYKFFCNLLYRSCLLGNFFCRSCLFGSLAYRSCFFCRYGFLCCLFIIGTNYNCIAVIGAFLLLALVYVVGGENAVSGLSHRSFCLSFFSYRLFNNLGLLLGGRRLGSFDSNIVESLFLLVCLNLAGLSLGSFCLRLNSRGSFGLNLFSLGSIVKYGYGFLYGSLLAYVLNDCVCAGCLSGVKYSLLNDLDFLTLNYLAGKS